MLHPRTRERVILPILGLTCGGGGALSIQQVLERSPGVIRAYVNPATEMAYIEYDPAQMDLVALQKAIDSVGYRTVLP
jgi:Cu+-exporting ATPase